MIQTKISEIEFSVDNYVETINFKDLITNKKNSSMIAAIIGCVEGIIKPSKDKKYYSFAEIYNVKSKSNYIFLNIYNFVNKNEKVYDYITNYFNLWHSKNNEEFSYDEFHKNDLNNNIYELVSLLYKERNVAVKLKDKKEAEAYVIILNNLYELFETTMVF